MAIRSQSSASTSTTIDGEIWPVHIEVRLARKSSSSYDKVRRLVYEYISENFDRLYFPTVVSAWGSFDALQSAGVERIVVSEGEGSLKSLPIHQCDLHVHVYQATEDSAYERLETNPSESSEEYNAGTLSELPSRELEGLWESLFYDGDVKTSLLNYIQATVGFSDADVDQNLVSWNRVVLLHGPPGTGKTSLCRALAQKLSIRLRERYNKTHLFEINSHSLFSRWFSESGKLVQNLFSFVSDLTAEEEDFVVLLIDEVESLTSARSSAVSGNEPSDALRVVNALLTQIDRLKSQKNVLIMATSNLANAIDCAFVDRADIIQYIDFPTAEAIYEILRSSLLELMNCGIVQRQDVPATKVAIDAQVLHNAYYGAIWVDGQTDQEHGAVATLRRMAGSNNADEKLAMSRFIGASLFAISEKCKGISGRSLRRLPVLAHARYIGSIPLSARSKQNGNTSQPSPSSRAPAVNIAVWLDAMRKVVDDQSISRQRFQQI